jgi:hypothetical protein
VTTVLKDGGTRDTNSTLDGKDLDALGSRPSIQVVIELDAAALGEREPEEAERNVEGGGNGDQRAETRVKCAGKTVSRCTCSTKAAYRKL